MKRGLIFRFSWLLAAAPVVAQAQFNCVTNNGAITITRYTGRGGAVAIPATITGLPVTSIGYYAFASNSLTSVTIPSSVTSVGAAAFYRCASLASIEIGTNVHSIGLQAFYYCTALASITIPNSVTSIEDGAFAGDALTEVAIPSSVTNIGAYVFGGPNLISIAVDTNDPAYKTVAGVLFNRSGTALIEFPQAVTGSYLIPDGVVTINDWAFENSSLNSVSIPDTVTSIGMAAFNQSFNLTSVTIPGSVATIGASAFDLCYRLTNLTILEGVASIGYNAFPYCAGLTSLTIPASVTNIGTYAFNDCSHLATIYFQGNAPTIGSNVFAGDPATICYVAGTRGWSNPWAGLPAQPCSGPVGTNSPVPPGWPMRDKDVFGSRNGGYATVSVDVGTYASAWSLTNASLPLSGNVLGGAGHQLVANATGGIGIYDGSGAQRGFIATVAQLACLADVNGDGVAEILAVQMDAAYNFQILVYQANGTLLKTIQVEGTGQSDQTVTPIFAADLNGDGQVEIVSQLTSGYAVGWGGQRGLEVTSYATGQRIWRSVVGPGPNGVRWPNVGGGNLVAAGWGPANGNVGTDGTADYANYTWSYGPATGAESWIRSYTSGGFYDSGAYLPDLNGDGKREIVATTTQHDWSPGDYGYGEVHLLNTNTGGDVSALSLGHFVDVWNGAFGNLDGVPGDEMVVATYEGTTPFLRAYGANLASKGSYSRPDGHLIAMGVADLAGTGAQQVLAVYRPTSGNDRLVILNGPLTQVLWERDLGAQTIQNVVVDDLNQDGRLEIAVAVASASGTNQVVVLAPSGPAVDYSIIVRASPSAGGTVIGGGTFAAGSMHTVTATANSGYTFTNWTENGSAVSSSTNYTFTLSRNRNLVANFIVNSGIGSPTISTQPAAITKLQGQIASFGVMASGLVLNYQWYGPTGAIYGATARGYTNLAVNLGDAGNYWVVVANSAGSVTSTVATLTVKVDTNKQTVTITSPKNLFETNVNAIRMVGTATTTGGRVSAVQVSVNGGGVVAASFTNANPVSATWGLTVSNLVPGTNTVRVYATSFAGTNSAIVTNRYFFRVLQMLTVQTNGQGTLKASAALPAPPTNGASLYVGRSYAITATGKNGFAFTNWLGGTALPLDLVTNGPTIQFLMQTNLVLQANFADVTKPALISIWPAATTSRLTNGLVIVEMRATDNVGVRDVKFYLNGQEYGFGLALGSNLWSMNLALPVGTNTVNAVATDGSNNSATDTIKLIYANPTTSANAITLSERHSETDFPSPPGVYSFLIQNSGFLNANLVVPALQSVSAETWSNLFLMVAFGGFAFEGNLFEANVLTTNQAVFYLTSPYDPSDIEQLTVGRSANTLLLAARISSQPDGSWDPTSFYANYWYPDGPLPDLGPFQDHQPFALSLQDGTTSETYADVTRTINITGNIAQSNSAQGGETHVAQVTGAADYTPPVISIIAPTDGQICSNAVHVDTGTARDNVGVSEVWVRVNSGGWQLASTANNWTNWTRTVSLVPGTNSLQTYAVDASGNPSATNQVRFIYNQFPALAATYSGLFYPTNDLGPTNCGAVTLTLGNALGGGFSGKLTLQATNLSFSGSFDSGLRAAPVNVPRAGKTPLAMSLQLNPVWQDPETQLTHSNVVTGTVADGTKWVSDVVAFRSFNGKNNGYAGTYTMLIGGSDSPADSPPGDGAATVAVSGNGTLQVKGNLADKTPLTFATTLPVDGPWPMFVSLYGGWGLFMGWMVCDTNLAAVPSTNFWIKPALLPKDPINTNGFAMQSLVLLSKYTPATAGHSSVNWTNGRVVLEFGNLPQPLTNSVVVSNNLVLVLGGPISNLTFGITNKDGTFGGSFKHPVSQAVVKFLGVLVQGVPGKRAYGGGWFVGPTEAGRVRFEPVE